MEKKRKKIKIKKEKQKIVEKHRGFSELEVRKPEVAWSFRLPKPTHAYG